MEKVVMAPHAPISHDDELELHPIYKALG